MRDIDAQAENIQKIWDDEEESNKRMDVIGQNGNLGIHYD